MARRGKPRWGSVSLRNPMVVFPALEWGRMQVANETLEDLLPQFEVELHVLVDRIRAIGAPAPSDEPMAVAA